MAVKKTKSAASAAKSASKAKSADSSSKKPAAKSKTTVAKTAKSTAKTATPAKKRAPATKKTPAKSNAPAAQSKTRASKAEPDAAQRIDQPVLDPIGDVISGEGRTYLGGEELSPNAHDEPDAEVDAFLKETHSDASEMDFEAGPGVQAARAAKEARAREKSVHKAQAATRQTGSPSAEAEIDEGEESAPAAGSREPAKLERLQKILSQAGVASRRTAEEMIVAGRVIVNGTIVTQLGSKADPTRDHIRVDGKLLQGAERHRYFMLIKPRGYVTTVSDPEGRPTVMEFFAGARERVYPVGRLDYLSEGLLLMTNDGELANLLTKAGSGVEKTYLVKVAGQPTAEELERLRAGVAIEKGEPGSARVRTAPARIRPFREGDNPWFEVVLIEGRNRELRKMFGAIGHFAEKIRRVGYGPLVLDLEPGKMRELDEDEVNGLRLAAEGKMKPRRAKAGQMPGEAVLPAKQRSEQRGGKTFGRPPKREFNRSATRETTERGAAPREDRFDRRPPRQEARGERPRWKQEERGPKKEWQPRSEGFRGAPKARPEFRGSKPFGREETRSESSNRPPFKPRGERPEFRSRPPQERSENRLGSGERKPFTPRSDRPAFRPGPGQERGRNRPASAQRGPFKPRSDRPKFSGGAKQERGGERFGSAPQRPFKPPFKPRSDRPPFRSGPQQERGGNRFGGATREPVKSERPQWKQDGEAKPRLEIERVERPQKDAGFSGDKPRPSFGAKPGFGGKPSGGGRPGGFGKYRGNTRGGPKRGASRPGAPRGGRKRG